ncbi:hypothetical protein GCM10017744_101630 [Streptomyces antimycoticus]
MSLERRVQRLTETRHDAVDTSAAELRRIERDLHDGAQARLVAMGMSLGTVEALIEKDPAKAKELPAGGAMIALQASEDEVAPLLTDRVSIAALNGPNSVVIAGDEDAATQIAADFEARGRKTKRLTVSHAFHSPHMDPMLADFRKLAACLTYNAPKIPLVSCLTGTVVSADEIRLPEFWVRHVGSPSASPTVSAPCATRV